MKQDPVPANFAARIRKLRGELTQTKFAERIGVSYVTINRWENGRYSPTPLAWKQILKLERRQRRNR